MKELLSESLTSASAARELKTISDHESAISHRVMRTMAEVVRAHFNFTRNKAKLIL